MEGSAKILDILSKTKTEFDKTLQFIDANWKKDHSKAFWKLLIVKPLFHFKQITDIKKGVGIVIATLSTPTPILVWLGTSWLTSSGNNPIHVINLLGVSIVLHQKSLLVVSGLIGYLISLYSNFRRMISLHDPQFHIEAYKLAKKEEWDFFQGYLGTNFSMSRTYDIMRDSELLGDQLAKEISDVRGIIEIQHKGHSEEVSKLEASILALCKEKEEGEIEFREYVQAADELINQYKIAVDNQTLLLKWSIDLIFQIYNKKITSKDFALWVGSYSIYELQQDKLVELFSMGTTITPKTIPLNDPVYEEWAIVQALTASQPIKQENVRAGHHIVSKKFSIGETTIVFNVHFDEQNQTVRDIIVNDQLYRLIEFTLLYLESRNLLREVS